ncbi:MAG: molybdate ABC transporter substrate-binding protein [Actinomycetota bacterium]
MSSRGGVTALVGVLLLLAACGSEGSASNYGSGSNEPQTITVFAAASLTDAFDEIAAVFGEAHLNVEVEFNFLASSDLAAQIIEGAPADIFASADEANMTRITDEGLAGNPVVFVLNRLAIAVPSGNPDDISSLSDLEDPELVVALCNEECPAWRYAIEIFETAGVGVEADSLEADVRGVLTRVGLGEADAGLVYVTDIAADPAVEEVEIPDEDNVVASYPIAVLEGAPQEAAEFVDFVRSEAGRRILSEYGFQLP